jgi:flagellar biosynthesis/type III secretory pathway chaperone
MENIYQQAIADAKALRASAMANAKSALQEAFEPKITEMVRLKLSEELEEVEELEEMEDLEEMEGYEEGMEPVDETIDESGLDEILAELEELANEGEHDGLNEAEEDEDAEEDDEEAMDDEDSEVEDAEEDIVDDETKVIDITLGDLKKVFQSLQAQEETPEMDDTDLEAAEEEDMEEPFSLDEILAELENEGKDHMYEKKDKEVKDDEEKHKMKEELNEAKKAIKQLQESFTEVNLLNAKLLYMNKLFKAKNLSESEKIRVVKAFDRASSVKEVKNTFDVLKESIETKKKSQIQESFGYASKPAGVSPSNNVIESDPFVSRWQKIAGL